MTELLAFNWGTVGSVLLAILILLAMITVHEFGHYIVGKLLKFRINEFSVGFGPALFKHKNKKTGELFSVRLIPLGGYCAFDGEDGIAAEEGNAQTPAEAPEEAFEEFRAPQTAAPEEDMKGGVSEAERLIQASSTTLQPKGEPFTKRPPWARILVLVAGAFMNYIFAVVLILIEFFACGQTLIAVYEVAPAEGEYAVYALADQDIILEADGRDVYLTTDLLAALHGKKQGDLVPFTVSRVVEWEEGAAKRREKTQVTVMLRADVQDASSADTDLLWRALGAAQDEEGNFLMANAAAKFGFFETIGRSFVYSFKIAGSIFRVLGELLTGRLGLDAFGGPVTTISMTAQLASMGLKYFLEIAGYIGVNLAVFNLLPIPALDGSKVVFTAIEWVRGKPISRKVEAVIHTVGFLLILGFALLVDILQFV